MAREASGNFGWKAAILTNGRETGDAAPKIAIASPYEGICRYCFRRLISGLSVETDGDRNSNRDSDEKGHS